ncbi:urease accessory protein UreF [Pseudahrensia aquimaris]|uniref:Urease accessory protein UreF n=1 Tax=Pseudahrensia aquimaris TaxID=744461 RepID=A0ABW3FEQ3_9HYPH
MALAMVAMPTTTATSMDSGFLRILSWLSPVFPTGSFAYSAGLENAVSEGWVADGDGLGDWLEGWLTQGRVRNELIFLLAALDSFDDLERISEINELALASCASQEQHLETTAQGRAFVDGMAAWGETVSFPERPALPVAVGAAAGASAIDRGTVATAYAHAFITNQTQIAIRLSVIGQTGAAALLARLESAIADSVEHACCATLDDIGSFAPLADIATMRHEARHARMFRT